MYTGFNRCRIRLFPVLAGAVNLQLVCYLACWGERCVAGWYYGVAGQRRCLVGARARREQGGVDMELRAGWSWASRIWGLAVVTGRIGEAGQPGASSLSGQRRLRAHGGCGSTDRAGWGVLGRI
jgi:hypothetical protein